MVRMKTEHPQPDDQLTHAAERHRRAASTADEARNALHQHIRRELARGVRQVDLARATGYTREYIRRLADDEMPASVA